MKLGIIGVSGLVGENVLTSLNLLDIKYDELYLFGSVTGKRVYNMVEYDIMIFENHYLNELDYIILCVDNNVAKEIIEYHLANNCTSVIIDNSSEFRLHDNIPLVIPEVNCHLLDSKPKIIANPNCSTTLLVMLLFPLTELAKINKVVISTYQAASGAGKKGYDELVQQVFDYSLGDKLTTNFWNKQYLFNVFSHNSDIDEHTKYNMEEMKIVNETCKILDNMIRINPTCIRVPTLRSHCLSVNIQFDKELNSIDIVNKLEGFPGITVLDNTVENKFPEPIIASKKTDIFVGRIRPESGPNYTDLSNWSFFISGDQLLKGASYNAVQILQKLLK